MSRPAVSICIPAYKQPEMLKRCLDSVRQQTFTDIEVIVTDDSPGDEVERLVDSYKDILPIRYKHNRPSLGTPENWNEAIRQATGKYIKLIHHDDWLATPDALQKLHDALEAAPGSDFAYGRALLVYDDGKESLLPMNIEHLDRVRREPEYVLIVKPISTPSVTLFRNKFMYDNRMKWMVDIDGYIHELYRNPNIVCVNEPLVKIGIHADQVTQECEDNKEVDVKEHIQLLDKLRPGVLKKWLYYDYFWRLLRRYDIRSSAELTGLAKGFPVPSELFRMAAFQSKLPASLWTKGVISKTGMFLCYLTSLLKK